MARPVLLFTGQWADLPLAELAQQTSEWGYAGLELCCWGDHFEVQRALSEPDYCQEKLDLLARHDQSVMVLEQSSRRHRRLAIPSTAVTNRFYPITSGATAFRRAYSKGPPRR